MGSTATHVAQSVYVCLLQASAPQKNDRIDRDAVWVWTHKAQGTITALDGVRTFIATSLFCCFSGTVYRAV